ncbi:MAG: hypothetical protein FJ117_16250 [Deltaproteobacteria bacterium]|nr:hypothetical protein [Deltaproteobacteria bacterium]
MINKALSLLISFVFLIQILSCSHAPKRVSYPETREEISSQKEIARSLNPPKEDEPWWKRDENQWFFVFLLVLGLGIATSASIWIFFNSGGLTLIVRK